MTPRRYSPARLAYMVGRRGSFLLFLTVLDLLFGLSLAFPATAALQSPSVKFLASIAPLSVWAAIWTAVGLLTLVGAFLDRDQWAFAAAMGLKAFWGSLHLIGWAFLGLERGWVAGVIWLVFAVVVGLIASWPEVQHARRQI